MKLGAGISILDIFHDYFRYPQLTISTMCRWFAYISNTEPCLLEDVLILPKHSLAKQVHDHYLPQLTHYEPDEDRDATKKEIDLRNRLFNIDGLGVAW